MLIILRILFGAAFLYALKNAQAQEASAPGVVDVMSAAYLAMCVGLAILNGIVWAPFFGAKLSEPIAGVYTKGSYAERRNLMMRLIHWLDLHGHRRLTLAACFLEGIHHPDWPTAFLIGLKNARQGSRLERVFALEVFKFDNAQNCLEAFRILQEHGINPGRHRSPHVNLVLFCTERQARPEPAILPVPAGAPPPPLKRNPRIRLFEPTH